MICLNTVIYALLHFFVDFVCAWSMLRFFTTGSYENLLIYNFCAFALQMPLGTLLDLLGEKLKRPALTFASLGIFLTVLGSLTAPAILGIGNALFHVGGGFQVIHEDLLKNHKGKNLGLFVAPGAIGLYLGKILGKTGSGLYILAIASVFMVVLLCFLCKRREYFYPAPRSPARLPAAMALCCFLVVVIRSYIGLGVTFSWSGVIHYGILAVCAAAFGKYAGGLLGSKIGISKTAIISLFLAALCYYFGNIPFTGILAIFFFNMTMPLTLYLLVSKMPHLAGFSFGLLTFGLFLGFLPVYTGVQLPVSASLLGAAGSIITCFLLIAAGRWAPDG